jgi:hypothetical protein
MTNPLLEPDVNVWKIRKIMFDWTGVNNSPSSIELVKFVCQIAKIAPIREKKNF